MKEFLVSPNAFCLILMPFTNFITGMLVFFFFFSILKKNSFVWGRRFGGNKSVFLVFFLCDILKLVENTFQLHLKIIQYCMLVVF